MPLARRVARPAGYVEIERALHLLDLGEGNRWVANRLHGVEHSAAREAQRLLRNGERAEASGVLMRALMAMAGPIGGERLTWFTPATIDRSVPALPSANRSSPSSVQPASWSGSGIKNRPGAVSPGGGRSGIRDRPCQEL